MKIKMVLLSLVMVMTAGMASAQLSDRLEGLQPLTLEYAGFEFQVPPGANVVRDSKMTVTYPNQTLFGMSLVNQVVRGSNQKRAYEMCERYARDFELKNWKVEKVTVAGSKGAKAYGEQEGAIVTILILPTNDNELTMVIMADPSNQGLTEGVISSMKR